MDTCDLGDLARLFHLRGVFVAAKPYGSGHINDSFQITCQAAEGPVHYMLQRINTSVFADPLAVMENIVRVTDHLRAGLAARGFGDVDRRTLRVIPAIDGAPCTHDAVGGWWRCYAFVEDAYSVDQPIDDRQAYEAARAYACFQNLLADLPEPRLHETIPFFHHAPSRLAALRTAERDDPRGRAADVRWELDFVAERAGLCTRLASMQAAGSLPERIVHNDTKINNVLLDARTGEGLCVVDLDTVMPGLALYDFGDLARSAASAAAEDDPDPAKAGLRLDRFEALTSGYLSQATFLTPAERGELVFSMRLAALVLGIRFLTDHLRGDTYFKIHRPAHNLDRCRAQFGLVASIEKQDDTLRRIVAQAATPTK